MAIGDTVITYPIVEPRISQGTTGTNIIYSMTVVSGPSRVGDAGEFVFRMDYVGLERDPQDTFVFHNINASFYFTQDYLDYRNNTRRIYMQGYLEEPPSRFSSYTYRFVVSAGWKHIELANRQFGNPYDPSPYGTFDGTTLRLWNGATFTVTGEGTVHETTDYAKINTTGVDRVRFALTGSNTSFEVRVYNASNTVLQPQSDLGYNYVTDDLRTPGDYMPPLAVSAPTSNSRIWQVTVKGSDYRRIGNFTTSWIFGVLPTAPETPGGGGTTANHGGVGIAVGVNPGGLRTYQSGMHQHFVRTGATTNVATTTSSGSSSASGSGVTND